MAKYCGVAEDLYGRRPEEDCPQMVTAGAFGAAIHGGHWQFSKRTLTQQIRRFLAPFARSTHPIRAAVAAALAIDQH